MRVPTVLRTLAVLGAVATNFVAAAEDAEKAHSDVINLTPDTFDKIVNAEDLMLVEFFAPWCGHCKALAPHYEEAATTLKDKIPLAKVDCVEQSELCGKHGVQGYPTLKVFRKGTPSDYKGPRQADGIVAYMKKQNLPAISDVTAANLEEFSKADKLVAVLFVSKTTDAPAPAFSEAAEKHRDDYLFGVSTDEEAIKAAGVTPPAFVLYKSFDDPRVDYESKDVSSLTVANVENFIRDNSLPLFGEVDGETYPSYAKTELPLAYLFIEPDSPKKADLVKALTPIAKKYKGKVNFVTIDAVKFSDHGKALNLLDNTWPSLAIQDLKDQLKYPLDQKLTVDYDTVSDFLERYVAGKIEPSLKSDPVPSSVYDGDTYILVGSEFEKIVYDDSKDVFVEFYAPWCGHCKRLAPTWHTLAERYGSLKDKITIAKMDATSNDIPPSAPFRVQGFPTIKFKPAGSRDFIDYDGDRSLENMIEFIEKNAKNPLVLPSSSSSAAPEPTETAETASETAPADVHDEL